MRWPSVASVVLSGLFLAACREDPVTVPPAGNTSEAVRSFSVLGVIRELPPGGRSLVIRHEAIPGYMPKMTMELTVRHPAELRGLSAGDEVRFQLWADHQEHWITDITRTGRRVEEVPAPVVTPSPGQLQVGDVVPDFSLLSETGQRLRLADFRGRVVALTFIFTRCPLPDFCPRMSEQFRAARQRLLDDATNSAAAWQFLSISFDPENDRPEVLARYAGQVRGGNAERWLFAVADHATLSAITPRFGLLLRKEQGSIQHNLRTVVIDREGRVFSQFDGNQWKPEEVTAAMVSALKHHPKLVPGDTVCAPRPDVEVNQPSAPCCD
jgi:protein SCO1/2